MGLLNLITDICLYTEFIIFIRNVFIIWLLSGQLNKLNVKTVIVLDKRFPVERVIEALKKSRIADRVRCSLFK
jgi:hypothetical protein